MQVYLCGSNYIFPPDFLTCPAFRFQPKPKKGKKKVAAAPLVAKKKPEVKKTNPLFEKRPKNFGIGEFRIFK